MAKLYGVGVGPGDSELMTLKAVRLIRESQVVALPRSGQAVNVAYEIAKGAVPDLDENKIVELSMPMTRDPKVLEESHRQAAEQIMAWLDEGKQVVFLTLGDPTVYSTYIYMHDRVTAAGYETEIVPGVPSFCAVAARLNIGLTEADKALHIIPASYDGADEALSLRGTKVLMKSGKSIGEIKGKLLAMDPLPEVSMVERCGMEGEKISLGVENIDENAGYFSVLIVR